MMTQARIFANETPRIATLTILQPWAHLILSGKKLVENRSWYTAHRGQLLIHAGKGTNWLKLNPDGTRDEPFDIRLADMAFGALVGVVDVVACLRLGAIRDGKYAAEYPWLNSHEHTEGPWCWVLQGAKRFQRQIPYRGLQKLWSVPRELVADAIRNAEPVKELV